jgi:hypothetical protein
MAQYFDGWLGAAEAMAIDRVIQFISQKLEVPEQRAIGTLSVGASTEYFTSAVNFIKPLRKILGHYIRLSQLLRAPTTPILLIDVESSDQPVDLFTAEPTDSALYATTSSASFSDSVGLPESWAHHILANGAIHPISREPIQSLGAMGSAVLLIPGLPLLTPEEEAALAQEILEPAPLCHMPIIKQELIQFEDLYGIPEERRYSALINDDTYEESDTEWHNEAVSTYYEMAAYLDAAMFPNAQQYEEEVMNN